MMVPSPMAGVMGALWLAGAVALACGDTRAQPDPSRQDPATTAPRHEGDPFIDQTLLQALKVSPIVHKAILVAYYDEDCSACDALEASTFSDERVLAWLDERVLGLRVRPVDAFTVRVNRLVQRPTVVFYSDRGDELGRVSGFLEPEAFLAAAGPILNGEDALERARARAEAAPQDPWQRFLLARILRRRELWDEARREMLWFFDHTREDPQWRDLREGEILNELGLMSARMSTVRADLIERRDAQLALLTAPPHEGPEAADEARLVRAARDIRLIGQKLNQGTRTLATWEALRDRADRPPAVLVELIDWDAVAVLHRARRFEDLLAAVVDPLVYVEQRISDNLSRDPVGPPRPETGASPLLARNQIVVGTTMLYEALLVAGREDEAQSLADLLLALDPRAYTFTSFSRAAKRALRDDLAQGFVERGLVEIADPVERGRLQSDGQPGPRDR